MLKIINLKQNTMNLDNSKGISNPLPTFLTITEVAKLLRVTNRTIYWLRRHKQFPGTPLGDKGKLLFDKTEVLNWLKINSNPNN